MTVQQVIETEIPNLINKSYLVYQFPSKALLNPAKEASVLQGQEIWIELARMHSPGIPFICLSVWSLFLPKMYL